MSLTLNASSLILFYNASDDFKKYCKQMLFPPNYDESRVFFIFIYIVLFIIGGIGNITVLINLLVKKFRNSSVKLLMIHLAIADMIVIFIVIPLEIIWGITLEWPTVHLLQVSKNI
ncbi:gonadotropin-releasing hormone II receptor-like protein [Leptotrombidium deliense]|uniref:Gonadotropin-releasing hormone II receptor-like protein n=1 Tax=Leptotrombidium deliense TaxID=299467 RepID=A0A443S1V7_9ACAR|nr:gonadotropin-releasing hormone II receptor-like protein [Leptotrombidium deliense]